MIYFGKGADRVGGREAVGATYGTLALVSVLDNGTKTSEDTNYI